MSVYMYINIILFLIIIYFLYNINIESFTNNNINSKIKEIIGYTYWNKAIFSCDTRSKCFDCDKAMPEKAHGIRCFDCEEEDKKVTRKSLE